MKCVSRRWWRKADAPVFNFLGGGIPMVGDGFVVVGENVRVKEEGDKILIELMKSHRGERSSSGKTTRVASTLGNKKVGDVFIGLNAYVK